MDKHNLVADPIYCNHIILAKDSNEQELERELDTCSFLVSNKNKLGRSMSNVVKDFQEGL